LPRLVIIPKILTVTTLADVRMLLEMRLPRAPGKDRHGYMSKTCYTAPARGQDEPGDAEIVLRMVLSIEGLECQPQ
jgi:hypothetical protein